MKSKVFLLVLTLLMLFITSEVKSQTHPQPFPDPQVTNPPDDWFLKLLFNNHFRIGGIEAGTSTYGYSVGVPVLWAADQLKIVPMLGWFWQAPSKWSGQAALGGKMLYFINKQQNLSKLGMNPYVGGFSMMEGNSRHNSGIAIGIEPNISRYLKLGFEIQVGLRSENGEDRGFGGAAITIGFGW
jgi:hypothetical protein